MKLLLFQAKRRWYVVFLGLLVFLIYFVAQPGYPKFYILSTMEIALAAVFGTFCCLALSNPAEVELCKCYGLAPSRLLTAQILPIYLAGAFSISITLIFYRFPGTVNTITPDQRLIYALTPFVTVAFFVAVNAFLRVLTRNTYVVVFLNMTVLFFPFYSFHDHFRFVQGWRAGMLFDPALAALLYNPQWNVTIPRFCINRVIFLALAIIFYVAACRLADRRSFEDFK